MKEVLTEKERDIQFDIAYGRFDYNDETADAYHSLCTKKFVDRYDYTITGIQINYNSKDGNRSYLIPFGIIKDYLNLTDLEIKGLMREIEKHEWLDWAMLGEQKNEL